MTSPFADDLFRREYAHLVAALVRILGAARLPLAEDAAQDALLAALHAWADTPAENPRAWLLRAAKNRAIDVVRRERHQARLLSTLASAEDDDTREDVDDELRLMFSLCDDTLSQETHVTLILRLLCGFSPTEIARAYVVDVSTIDRRLHRGRARLAETGLHDVTQVAEVAARAPSVHLALYLLFNEGYHGSTEGEPLHPQLCADALRLVELLIATSATATPEAHALAALFCFHGARLPARFDETHSLVLLAEQDRTRWDRGLIERGVVHLAHAAEGDLLSRYHLEAGIAFEHAQAASVATTSWSRIVELYDLLWTLTPSPVVALNRALAIGELRGPAAGRAELGKIAEHSLRGYPEYWAARASLALRTGDAVEARRLYTRALEHTKNRAEQTALQKKLAALLPRA